MYSKTTENSGHIYILVSAVVNRKELVSLAKVRSPTCQYVCNKIALATVWAILNRRKRKENLETFDKVG